MHLLTIMSSHLLIICAFQVPYLLLITFLFCWDFFSGLFRTLRLLSIIEYEFYAAAFSSLPLQSLVHLSQLQDGFFVQVVRKREQLDQVFDLAEVEVDIGFLELLGEGFKISFKDCLDKGKRFVFLPEVQRLAQL